MQQNKTYKRVIPGKEIRGERAQFENVFIAGRVSWCVRLYVGEGKKNIQTWTVESDALRTAFVAAAKANRTLLLALQKIDQEFLCWATGREELNSNYIQTAYVNRCASEETPDGICDWIQNTVNSSMPSDFFSQFRIPTGGFLPISKSTGIRARIIGAALLGGLIAKMLGENTKPSCK